jgi:hypothetical protein
MVEFDRRYEVAPSPAEEADALARPFRHPPLEEFVQELAGQIVRLGLTGLPASTARLVVRKSIERGFLPPDRLDERRVERQRGYLSSNRLDERRDLRPRRDLQPPEYDRVQEGIAASESYAPSELLWPFRFRPFSWIYRAWRRTGETILRWRRSFVAWVLG